jgi:hypothetical protein
MTPFANGFVPVLLYGMGVESTAILLRCRSGAQGDRRQAEPQTAHDTWTSLRLCAERGTGYPAFEDYYVAALSIVETKARAGVERFDHRWRDATDLYCGRDDLPLFDGLPAPSPLDNP